MTRWITAGDAAWGALFTTYRESAYRLECQQVYCSAAEDEALAKFLSGRPVDIDLSWSNARTRAQRALGRTKTKVRIVVDPPTPYTRLELSQYPRMAEAGEEILILATPQGEWPADQPHHDYWLFDEHDVWRMHYHENFRFKGAELLDDPQAVAEHLAWRNSALAEAVPLHEYLAALPTDHQERTTA